MSAMELFQALGKGDASTVTAILQESPDFVNATLGNSGWTPLHSATRNGNSEMIKLLLNAEASVNAANNLRQTPLHFACQGSKLEAVKLLLERKADVNASDQDGWTPLHVASREGQCQVIDLLLDNGARVSAVDSHRHTPLHFACAGGQRDAVEILLERGAEVNATNEDDEHALMFGLVKAVPSGFPRCAMELISHGAAWTELHTALAIEAVQKHHKVTLRDQQLAMLAAIREWVDQREAGETLVELPEELIRRGPDDVRAYFSTVKKSDSLIYRKKLFFVGPSTWGKTSLIKSLKRERATLEKADQRTIGIDLYSWEFCTIDSGETRKFQASVWDLAGQDVYHSAHSIFYSERTMYLICVNLEAYRDKLSENNLLDHSGAVNSKMDEFVNEHIYRWIRGIYARVPKAEFVFVGTKLDAIDHDVKVTEIVMEDLMKRLERKEEHEIDTINQAIQSLKEELSEKKGDLKDQNEKIPLLEDRLRTRPNFLSKKLNCASSATSAASVS